MRRYLPFSVAFILPILITFYWWMANLSFVEDRIYYGLILFYRDTALNVLFLTLLSFFALLFGGLFGYRYLNARFRRVYLFTFLLLFVSAPFSCFAAAFNFMEFGTSFTHVSRVVTAIIYISWHSLIPTVLSH